ncbi:hypothetical protein BGZ95_001431 [Linnemannia exigua]|uniref:HTH CENPB-type domain-containing protein n=1 Tax=Linnemannia exigua TaxID=604196 RepID=A0AAD4D7F0_9FUNG|nr:hypothetical protein BGZ95_001431 [Linnemannia exigua]
MGVFGEKHTSLTREQKRQLIHQADTHKLRPTEVCDWVQATWGLRIARVTVYSILHKQRASLMAGHKDLYQTVQNSLGGLTGSNSSSSDAGQQNSTNTFASAEDCLDRNKETGRVNKYRASPNKNKNKSKDVISTTNGSENNSTATATTSTTKASSRKTTESSQVKRNATATTTTTTNNSNNSTTSSSNSKRDRSSSVASDRSCSSTSTAQDGPEGTKWEGQLKRVREPASVELDRAMVEFLKSPASVDSQGRRLNDAELQSHALRLAQSIPSASRMRCSFGWLRHFKRRLGVQWAADRLGRYRWIVEMDRQSSSSTTSTASTPAPTFAKDTTKVKQEHNDDNDQFADDGDEEYHSTNEFGETPSPKKRSRRSVSGSTASSSLYHDNSILSIQSTVPQLHQQHSPQSILDSYPTLFGTLPPLHIPSTATTMGTISPMATTLDPKLSANGLSSCATSTSAFGMSVDGKMRKVPTKEEAYEMLQSLLMYYEQDHSYIGEQQTLLLPRWIHQQRQIMQQIQENDPKMTWLRQHNNSLQQQQQQQHAHATTPQSFLFPYQALNAIQPLSTEPHHPYHRYHSSFSSSTCSTASPPALSPMSPMSPLSPESPTLSSPFSLGPVLGGLQNDPFISSAKADLAFSSTMASLEHQMLGGHPAFSS